MPPSPQTPANPTSGPLPGTPLIDQSAAAVAVPVPASVLQSQFISLRNTLPGAATTETEILSSQEVMMPHSPSPSSLDSPVLERISYEQPLSPYPSMQPEMAYTEAPYPPIPLETSPDEVSTLPVADFPIGDVTVLPDNDSTIISPSPAPAEAPAMNPRNQVEQQFTYFKAKFDALKDLPFDVNMMRKYNLAYQELNATFRNLILTLEESNKLHELRKSVQNNVVQAFLPMQQELKTAITNRDYRKAIDLNVTLKIFDDALGTALNINGNNMDLRLKFIEAGSVTSQLFEDLKKTLVNGLTPDNTNEVLSLLKYLNEINAKYPTQIVEELFFQIDRAHGEILTIEAFKPVLDKISTLFKEGNYSGLMEELEKLNALNKKIAEMGFPTRSPLNLFSLVKMELEKTIKTNIALDTNSALKLVNLLGILIENYPMSLTAPFHNAITTLFIQKLNTMPTAAKTTAEINEYTLGVDLIYSMEDFIKLTQNTPPLRDKLNSAIIAFQKQAVSAGALRANLDAARVYYRLNSTTLVGLDNFLLALMTYWGPGGTPKARRAILQTELANLYGPYRVGKPTPSVTDAIKSFLANFFPNNPVPNGKDVEQHLLDSLEQYYASLWDKKKLQERSIPKILPFP
jgi:hypothetical protein